VPAGQRVGPVQAGVKIAAVNVIAMDYEFMDMLGVY
jgi:hypothetical protein